MTRVKLSNKKIDLGPNKFDGVRRIWKQALDNCSQYKSS